MPNTWVKAFYKRHPHKAAEYSTKRRKCSPEAVKRDTLKYRFNTSLEKANAIFTLQFGKCAICDEPLLKGSYFALDHDHSCCNGRISCGRCVREYLCRNCNWRLSILEDTLWIQRASAYVAKHKRSLNG